MPVLYGVFLYMGVSSLRGLQFFDRLLLLFMPAKNQPNYVFLKYVPLKRVHLFTMIQLMSLIGLWLIKSFPSTSIAFPVMLVVICFIRKIIECIFTKQELRALDDLLPKSGNKNKRKIGFKPSLDQELNESDEDDYDGIRLNKKNLAILDAQSKKRYTDSEAMNEELEELMTMKINTTRHRRMKTPVGRGVKSPVRSPPPAIALFPPIPEKRVTMYLKLVEDDIYTPVHLCPLTMENLIKTMTTKFAPLKYLQITSILEKTVKGITFPLDDGMLEFFKDHQVFHLSYVEDTEGCTVVTMVEQKIE